MPTVKIDGLGDAGINQDLPPYDLAPNAFSAGKNIRFLSRRAQNFNGYEIATEPPLAPFRLFAVQTPSRETLWIEAGTAQVYVYDGVRHTNITRTTANYNTDEYTDRWTGGFQESLAFLCNGDGDGPQLWTPIQVGTPLVDMTWDPTASVGSRTWQELSYRAYAMRPFKSTIIAMNLTQGATRLPSTVAWCDFIAPGDTETDWVERTTNSARSQSIGPTSGNIIDGRELRDDFIIYKEDSAFRMSFTGDSNAPFRFDRLPEYTRIINRGCIGVAGEFHAVASRDDLKVFDGNVFRSVLQDRNRTYFQKNLWPERQQTAFVSVLHKESEVWLCFATPGLAGELKYPDRAIVWNYADNTQSITDLPGVKDLDQGVVVPPVLDKFDDIEPLDLTFDQDFALFDETPFSQAQEFMIGTYDQKVSVFGEEPTEEGKPRECVAERIGLQFQDAKTGLVSNARQHRIGRVRPYIETTGTIFVQLAIQDAPEGPITWLPEQEFDPKTQTYLSFRAVTRYWGYRIRSNAQVIWGASKIELDYVVEADR